MATTSKKQVIDINPSLTKEAWDHSFTQRISVSRKGRRVGLTTVMGSPKSFAAGESVDGARCEKAALSSGRKSLPATAPK